MRVSCFMCPESHANRTKHAIELATATEFAPASDRSRKTTYRHDMCVELQCSINSCKQTNRAAGFPLGVLGHSSGPQGIADLVL